MSEKETRRKVPLGRLTIILFAVLAVLELLVLIGALEVRASTVKRIAPWAYGPFLRLVGEHPETRPEWAARNTRKKSAGPLADSGIAGVAGLDGMTETGTNIASGVLLEPSVPVADEPEAVDEPATNRVDESVPVG